MTDGDKREMVKFIFSSPYNVLLKNYYDSSPKERNNIELISKALIARIERLNGNRAATAKIAKFLVAIGKKKAKPPVDELE